MSTIINDKQDERLSEFNNHYRNGDLEADQQAIREHIYQALDGGTIQNTETIKSLRLLAKVLDEQGKYADAAAMYKTALFVSLHVFGEGAKQMENFGRLAELGGKCFMQVNQGKEAERLFWIQLEVKENLSTKAEELKDKYPTLFKADDNAITKCLVNLGNALRLQGKHREAEAIYTRALWKMEKNPASTKAEPKAVKDGLFVSQLKQGKIAEAMRTLVGLHEGKLKQTLAA